MTRLLLSWISPPKINSSSIKYTCTHKLMELWTHKHFMLVAVHGAH
jgi:hypothetical protein